MTAKIGKPVFSSARAAGVVCVFLSGVGAAGVMSHLPDRLGNTSTLSCGACRVAVMNSSTGDMDQASDCSPETTAMEPLLAATTGSAAIAPGDALTDGYSLVAQSIAWQRNPAVWEPFSVRF